MPPCLSDKSQLEDEIRRILDQILETRFPYPNRSTVANEFRDVLVKNQKIKRRFKTVYASRSGITFSTDLEKMLSLLIKRS